MPQTTQHGFGEEREEGPWLSPSVLSLSGLLSVPQPFHGTFPNKFILYWVLSISCDWHLLCGWLIPVMLIIIWQDLFSHFLFFHVWRWIWQLSPLQVPPALPSPSLTRTLSESPVWTFRAMTTLFLPFNAPPSAVLQSLSSYPALWQTTYNINIEKGQFQLALVSDV